MASPRLLVYGCCAVLAVLMSYHLGKDMLWDTMDYHIYAGFSALHNRFGRDYFAAGPQGYFNPYAYVPFYLLLRSGLAPLADASILAVLQSAILWLTYELATATVAPSEPRTRVAIGVLAALFAFANPILINELGSSFSDITTAEIALAGWLVLIAAVRAPGAVKVACGAVLLGVASALKPTNAVHALAAATLVLFIPGWGWRKLRDAGLFGAGVGVGFVLVSLPWSIRLQRHFGNPVFPLLNGIFHSPEYSSAAMLDHRFIPASLGAALLRPFAIAAPVSWTDFEIPAPDLRYALLLVLAVLVLLRLVWRRTFKGAGPASTPGQALATRVLAALGCAFLVDWVLWLTASGNGRYFIPMACVAAVLCMALIFRLFAGRPALRNALIAAVLGAQFFQLYAGTEYRDSLPWRDGPWYSVSVPAALTVQPNLYFTIGEQSNSFIIPDLPRRSGFVNLDGVYALGPGGANGRRIDALIRRFTPHLRVLWPERSLHVSRTGAPFGLKGADDVLEPFGLSADARRCSVIVAHGIDNRFTFTFAGQRPGLPGQPARHTEYLVTCHVKWDGSTHAHLLPGQRAADLAFDHLAQACPALFEPPRPNDSFRGDKTHGYVFIRNYQSTGVQAWIGGGVVRFQKLLGGQERDAGPETLWESGAPRVACGRSAGGFLKVLPR